MYLKPYKTNVKMRRLLLLLTIIATCCMLLSLKAQVTARVEISRDADTDEGRFVPIGEKGVLRYSFLKKKEKGKNVYKIMHFDTDLKLVHADSVIVERNMSLDDTISHSGVYYSILRDNRDNFTLVGYNPTTNAVKTVSGKFRKKASMRNLVMDGSHLVFSSTEKKLDRLGIIDLSTGQCRYTDMHFKDIRDQYIYILDNVIIDGKIHALVRIGGDVVLMMLDFDGNFVGQPAILTANLTDHHILTASLSSAGGHYFVTGTYTDKERGDATKIANGIYFGQFNGKAFTFIKFYNFYDLKNFTQFMSEKGKEKVERNKEKAEKKGKTFNQEYCIASHDIVEHGGDYYYMGEAYYPLYIGMGGPMGYSRTFEGFAYTHAFIVKFDKQGDVLWDNCVPLNPKSRPHYVKHFVNALYTSNQVDVLYVDDKKVISKTFDASTGDVVKERSEETLQTADQAEKVNKSRSADAEYWYGNNFLIFGEQQVKNDAEKKRRYVYFMNKLTIK